MKLLKKIFVLLLLFVLGCQEKQTPVAPEVVQNVNISVEPASFDSLFLSIDTVTLAPDKSFSEFPLDVRAARKSGQDWIAIDAASTSIRIFGMDGEERRSFGREGSGPVEFGSPEWVDVLPSGSIVIRDGAPNFTYHVLSSDGQPVRAVPIGAFGPFTDSFIYGNAFATVTRAQCTGDVDSDFCTIMLVDQDTGDVIRSIVGEDQIEPGFKGLPFVAALDPSDDSFWVAHRRGRNLVHVDSNGKELWRWALNDIPGMDPIDMAALPSDQAARVEASSKQTRTFIRRMHVIDKYLLIETGWMGPDRDERPLRTLTVIDTASNKVYSGLHPRGTILDTNGKMVTFLQDSADDTTVFETYELSLKH